MTVRSLRTTLDGRPSKRRSSRIADLPLGAQAL